MRGGQPVSWPGPGHQGRFHREGSTIKCPDRQIHNKVDIFSHAMLSIPGLLPIGGKAHSTAPVAQWIEQWIPNPCAACSIHAGGTNKIQGVSLSGLTPFLVFGVLSPGCPHFYSAATGQYSIGSIGEKLPEKWLAKFQHERYF